MKHCILYLTISLLANLFFSLPAQAQGPDRLPEPAIPEEELEGSPSFPVMNDIDSLLSPNVLRFCGQEVNLDPLYRQRKLRRELASLSRHSSTLMQRANYFFPIIEPILEKNNIPDDFKYLMVIESGLNPEARSPMGALGLWQFMKGTAQEYGLRVDRKIDERLDIEKSTQAACRYLQTAYNKFKDWVAVAQSYNIGQGRIGTELERQQVDESIDLQLVEETNRYIYRILASKIIFTNPSNFGLKESMLYYKKIRRK